HVVGNVCRPSSPPVSAMSRHESARRALAIININGVRTDVEALAVVNDVGGLAVYDLAAVLDHAAVLLHHTLVAQTHAQDRDLARQRSEQLACSEHTTHTTVKMMVCVRLRRGCVLDTPASLGQPGPGEMTSRSGASARHSS